jgi:LPS-assembly lipoprotein
MWWSSPSGAARRRAGRRALAAMLGAALVLSAGCGFQPLYGEGTGGEGVGTAEAQFAAVQITPLPDRTGQQLHNLLRDRLNPRGQPVRPRYRLDVQLREVRENLGIRVDETATRANLTVIGVFVLRESETGAVLFASDARSTNSFNILTNQFATGVAENDARERGLREVADGIRARLGIYFSRRDEEDL